MRHWCTVAALGVIILLSPAGWPGGPGTAFAHNTLVGSEPVEGAQLATGPKEVRLTFDQPVRSGEGYNTVSVSGPDGTFWTDQPARVDGSTVTAPVRELGPAGTYTVAYRVLSSDGHPVTGKVSFAVHTPGAGTPVEPPSGQDQQATDSGGMPVWPWIAGAVGLVLLGLVLALRLGKPGDRR